VFKADPASADEARRALDATRRERDAGRVAEALARLAEAAKAHAPIIPASIACARARVTTGEWADTLRRAWGEYRAATGVDGAAIAIGAGGGWDALRARVAALVASRGRRPRVLVGKPGLDGHSNGAEMVAVAARDAGLEVIYAGIRSTPEAIAQTAVQEAVDVVGLSILSGSHVELAGAVTAALAARGAGDVPVVVGGIVPAADGERLRALGVARVFTPSDFRLVDVIGGIVDLLAAESG
jgi:(2R)-ethylmalonyl-CoA mutase